MDCKLQCIVVLRKINTVDCLTLIIGSEQQSSLAVVLGVGKETIYKQNIYLPLLELSGQYLEM